MRIAIVILAAVCLPSFILAQTQAPSATSAFPKPDVLLHDLGQKEEKPRVVLSPMKTDSQGKTTGSFAVYGGVSLVEVSSLSFSGNGKFLAVGSTPNGVDVWNVETRTKVRSLMAGTTVALSPDGQILASDGKGIEIWDLPSGKLKTTIKWAGGTIRQLSFDNSGRLLLVTSNGDNDTVFDPISGERLATLLNTQHGEFSRDGSVVIGGNAKHIMVWSTKDWSPIGDLPNGPDYVTRFAASPQKGLIVVGGPNSARLVRLSSGAEIAKVGVGYTNYAAFDQSGSHIFMYPSSGFAVLDTTGKQLCGTPNLGNGTVAQSADDRWLAAAPVNGGKDVMLWDAHALLATCGVPAATKAQWPR